MPTYEYACGDCGHHLEVYQSFSDDPLTTCPSCGSTLRKVFGAVGIVLKGSGFYRNDNRTTPSARSAKPTDRPTPEDGNANNGAKREGKESSTASSSSSGSSASPASSSNAAPSSGATASASA